MFTLLGFWTGLAIGLLIGWQIPQPQWVKDTWERLKAKITKQ